MKYHLQIACSDTPDLPSRADLQKLIALLSQKLNLADRIVTLRIVDADESRQLNKTYRNKDKPTNVLSFPNGGDSDFPLPPQLKRHLGDLVLCHTVIVEEALAQNKPLQAHYIHLIIHGILHLLDYDHEEEHEALIMEKMEIDLLSALNIRNPYEENNHGA